MTDPYENLANAIVITAAKDYRDALRSLTRNKNIKSLFIKMHCKRRNILWRIMKAVHNNHIIMSRFF